MTDRDLRGGDHFPTVAVEFIPAGSTPVEHFSGARIASRQYLKALVQYYSGPLIIFGAHSQLMLEHCNSGERLRCVSTLSEAASIGFDVLFRFYPSIGDDGWVRLSGAKRPYLIQGITHSISPVPVIRDLQVLHTTPIGPFDSILATSQAVEQALKYLMPPHLMGPTIARIPLGISPATAPCVNSKSATRQLLGLAENAFVLIQISRMTFAEKFYPHAILHSAECAARRIARPISLFLCGTYPNRYMRDAFEGLNRIAPSVDIRTFEHVDDAAKRQLMVAADCMLFAVDNYQESFGLAVLEAMALGLPVIASDFSGIRDLVDHGVTGLLVPTTSLGLGHEHLFAKIITGDVGTREVNAISAQGVVLDTVRLADNIVALASSVAKCAEMGEAGHRRATSEFSWESIVRRLEGHLQAQHRRLVMDYERWHNKWSEFYSVHHIFKHYSSAPLDDQTIFSLNVPTFSMENIMTAFFDWRHVGDARLEQLACMIFDAFSVNPRCSLAHLIASCEKDLADCSPRELIGEFMLALVKIGNARIHADP